MKIRSALLASTAVCSLLAACAATPEDLANDGQVETTSQAVTINGVVTLATYFSAASNPGALSMYEYVPISIPAIGTRPLVVVLPGCGQSAATYAVQSGWTRVAELKKLNLVIAQQSTMNNLGGCFNWFSLPDAARTGGEAQSIAQMVTQFKLAHPGKVPATKGVYVSGLSAGGAMAAVMLATYPDVFHGGAINSGVPYGCALPAPQGLGLTTDQCMGSSSVPFLTPPAMPVVASATWGALAKNASGLFTTTSPKPSVVIFQGDADAVVKKFNMGELKQQWTNYDNLDEAAFSLGNITTLKPRTFPRTDYAVDFTTKLLSANKVRTVLISGMTHGVAIDQATIGAGLNDQCGTASTNVLNVGLCTSYYSADFWGI